MHKSIKQYYEGTKLNEIISSWKTFVGEALIMRQNYSVS